MVMSDKCSCEGSCPVCRIGTVENHKCNRCRFEFCPACHGTMPKYKAKNVLPCLCRQNIFVYLWELFENRMRKIQAKRVAEEISNLPPDRLLKFLDTGEAEISPEGKTLEIMPLRNEVLEKIHKAWAKNGFADREEIIQIFKKEFGVLCSRAARKEISLLVKDGIIKEEEMTIRKKILRGF